MNNTLTHSQVEVILNKELVIREATNDIKLETSYCSKCKKNHYSNIGSYTCKFCGGKK